MGSKNFGIPDNLVAFPEAGIIWFIFFNIVYFNSEMRNIIFKLKLNR